MARGKSRADECVARITAVVGYRMSDKELEAIFSDVQTRAAAGRAKGNAPGPAARGAGADAAAAKLLAAKVAKRELLNNIKVRRDLNTRVIERDEYNSLKGMSGGTVHEGWELGRSADAMGHHFTDDATGAFLGDMRRADLLSMVRKVDSDTDRQMTREMWWRGDPNAPADRPVNSAAAKTGGEIAGRHVEDMRLALNEAGAWIGKLEHYVVRQSHDMWKISAVPYEKWRDTFVPRLRPDSFDGIPADMREPVLRETYNALATGVHDKANGAKWLGGFTGEANLAKKLSQEREWHFKGPDEFWEYNAEFGKGTIMDAVLQTLQHGGKNLGLMKTFGANPPAMFKDLIERQAVKARNRGDPASLKMATKLSDGSLIDLMEGVSGTKSNPRNMSLAWWAGTNRTLNNMIGLGFMVPRSLNDIAVNASMLRHNGVPILQGIAHQMVALLPKGGEARREALIELNGTVKGILNSSHARMMAEDSRLGGLAKASNIYFKVNASQFWNESQRDGSASGVAAMAAYWTRRYADITKLRPIVQGNYARYGIGQAEWQALRQVETRPTGRGRERFLMPRDILNLPDEAVAHLPGSPAAAKERLREKLGTMITDQVREGMSEGTAATRHMLTLGTQSGTGPGELARSLVQFGTYPANFMIRSIGRELHRSHGMDRVLGIANLMVGVTVYGALSNVLVDLLQGKGLPRFEEPADYVKFVGRALLTGGAIGIFGDFLFGQALNNHRGFIEGLLGPTAGTIDDVAVLLGIIETGDEKDTLLGRAVKFGVAHAPFVNLFYLSAILKQLFFHGLQELVNPGYMNRLERRLEHEKKQEYWLRPTEAVRY